MSVRVQAEKSNDRILCFLSAADPEENRGAYLLDTIVPGSVGLHSVPECSEIKPCEQGSYEDSNESDRVSHSGRISLVVK